MNAIKACHGRAPRAEHVGHGVRGRERLRDRLTDTITSATGWFVVHRDLRSVPRIRAVMDTTAALLRAHSVKVLPSP